ncbi:DUF397 domain-containing protein [Nonomuraea sp. NPDC059023]|uniref:DUF397 domain-containing protein n=1 Tax=unclassified Nonomuraea TaxID=2593643 RepID=UPI003683955B
MDRSSQPLAWRKSTFSGQGDNCVEVADLPEGGRALRDSKDPGGSVLRFTHGEWEAFKLGMAAGEFD